jgi:hypothetical protein
MEPMPSMARRAKVISLRYLIVSIDEITKEETLIQTEMLQRLTNKAGAAFP